MTPGRRIGAVTLVVLGALGCTAAPADQSDPTPSPVTSPAPVTTPMPAPDSTVAATTTLPDASVETALGVVFAALLLARGDIESALANGLVTAEEVELATRAIEEDTLEAWIAIAAAG